MSEKKKLKSVRELVLSLDPALAEQVLNETTRYLDTDFPAYEDLADLIMSGFVWEKTPQGADYWSDVHENVLASLKSQTMSEKKELKSARELVRSPYLTPSQAMTILEEAGRYERTDVPLYTDLPNLIMSGFVWEKTLQGTDYWNDLYERLHEKHRTQD